MNKFNRKPAHAVPNWQAPASTEKKQPAIKESQVEGARGQARLRFSARGRRGRPVLSRSAVRRGLWGGVTAGNPTPRLVVNSPKRYDKPPFFGFHLLLDKPGNSRMHAPLAMALPGARGTLGKTQIFASGPFAVTEGNLPSQGGLFVHKHTHTHTKAHAQRRTRGLSHTAPSSPPFGTTAQAP